MKLKRYARSLQNPDTCMVLFHVSHRADGLCVLPAQDLLLFPSDATFERVTQADGRVFVLKFSSSDQRHFVSFSSSFIVGRL